MLTLKYFGFFKNIFYVLLLPGNKKTSYPLFFTALTNTYCLKMAATSENILQFNYLSIIHIMKNNLGL